MSQQIQTFNVPLFACRPKKTQRKSPKITMLVSVSNWASIRNPTESESYRNAAEQKKQDLNNQWNKLVLD